LPFVFVDDVARFVCSDFLHVDAVAFEDVDHLPDAGDVVGGASLEPTDAEAKLVTSEGSWLFQILAEPSSQFVQFIGVGACDVMPLQSLRCRLKNPLLNMTVLVFAADDEADVFAVF
jgi:hypothetical protein